MDQVQGMSVSHEQEWGLTDKSLFYNDKWLYFFSLL